MGLFVIIVIAVMFVLIKVRNGKSDNHGEKTVSQATTTNNKIDKNFSDVAISFFSGYLSLCKSHHVTGHAYAQETANANNSGKLDFLIACELFTIDDEHASDVFDMKKRVISAGQAQINQEVADTLEQIRKRENLRDNSMRAFFHCDTLFYPFCEIEEYAFNDPSVTIQCSSSIFTSFGLRKDMTFEYVKRELLKTWPEAEIVIGKYGMEVNS